MLTSLLWVLDHVFDREIIGLRGEAPYLIRWIVYRRKSGAGVYLHLFIGDDAADPHDHPKTFTSIGLWGSYDEEVFEPDRKWIHHQAPWIRRFGPMHKHRIVLDGGIAFTLVKVGPTQRIWGFYPPEGWVPWTLYKPGQHDLKRRGATPGSMTRGK